MYKKPKILPRPPVDVTHLKKLTADERQAQSCDPRSRIAEMSADPDRPVAVSEDHPNLGGRRIFLHAYNALFEHVPRVRKSRLQRPNLKALHLHSAACQWRRVEMARESLFSDNHMSEYDVEWVGMDFMEAAVVAVYGAVAAIELFSQEVMIDRVDASPKAISRPHDLVETLRDVLPKLTESPKPTGTCWWQEFRNIHRVRNSVTHSAGNDVGTAEDVAKAWESLMSPKLDPPDVVRRVIGHFSESEPPWVRRVIERGRTMAEGTAETTAEAGSGMEPADSNGS